MDNIPLNVELMTRNGHKAFVRFRATSPSDLPYENVGEFEKDGKWRYAGWAADGSWCVSTADDLDLVEVIGEPEEDTRQMDDAKAISILRKRVNAKVAERDTAQEQVQGLREDLQEAMALNDKLKNESADKSVRIAELEDAMVRDGMANDSASTLASLRASHHAAQKRSIEVLYAKCDVLVLQRNTLLHNACEQAIEALDKELNITGADYGHPWTNESDAKPC